MFLQNRAYAYVIQRIRYRALCEHGMAAFGSSSVDIPITFNLKLRQDLSFLNPPLTCVQFEDLAIACSEYIDLSTPYHV